VPALVRTTDFETDLDLRPARFTIGLGERVRWEDLPWADSAPSCGAFYLGRADAVTDEEVLATLWERPSGREATTTLNIRDHFEGQPPNPGDLLRIWTWVELPGEGEQRPGIKVTVETRELTEAERRHLGEVADKLEKSAGKLDLPDEEASDAT
jgi:hypothetical protein